MSDWMLECDNCGHRLPANEKYRGSGDAGLAKVRELAAADGWISESEYNTDICPKCAEQFVGESA